MLLKSIEQYHTLFLVLIIFVISAFPKLTTLAIMLLAVGVFVLHVKKKVLWSFNHTSIALITLHLACVVGISFAEDTANGFEYMAAGLPLIMSDFEYWKPYFEGCAIHIETAQPDLIASAIMELINDSSKYRALATEASLNCERYSWKGQFELLHQFYQEILTS